jgi:hypothetical protein
MMCPDWHYLVSLMYDYIQYIWCRDLNLIGFRSYDGQRKRRINVKRKQIRFTGHFLVTGLLVILTLVMGSCSSSGTTLTGIIPRTTTTTTTQTTVAAKLVSIAITQSSPVKILLGATEQFTAEGTFSDGTTEDITYAVIWNSSDATIASIAYGGLATAIVLGNTDVTAAINGTISNVVILEVVPSPAPTLTSIAVSRSLVANLVVGQTEQFTAQGSYSDGATKDITSQVTWTSTDTSIAAISSTGSAAGLKPGQTVITATLSGVTSIGTALTVISH